MWVYMHETAPQHTMKKFRSTSRSKRLKAVLPVPSAVYLNVSLLILNPRVTNEGDRRINEVLGWNEPDRLIDNFVLDIKDASYGFINYSIRERIFIDDFPTKEDGFKYDGAHYVRCWLRQEPFHQPDAVDYQLLLSSYQIEEKIRSGTIDEVWTIGFPYAGFAESRMAGPGAFWCNSQPLSGMERSGRRFIIMAFNFERGVGEMLESYGHRAESLLDHAFREDLSATDGNAWQLFQRHDLSHPNQAEVGTIHFAPNSERDYDWGNTRTVLTHSEAWLNFPDLSAEPSSANCELWGNGDTRAHHIWWFRHLPHVSGRTEGRSNNWWEYVADPNQ